MFVVLRRAPADPFERARLLSRAQPVQLDFALNVVARTCDEYESDIAPLDLDRVTLSYGDEKKHIDPWSLVTEQHARESSRVARERVDLARECIATQLAPAGGR